MRDERGATMNEWEWQLLEDKTLVDHLLVSGAEVRTGDRVRLFPHKGGDILDLALRGQIAMIEGIEQDYEGKSHVCVVLDNDPGRDLGLLRQPGHRFFFDSSEIEPLPLEERTQKAATRTPRILVAGLGNIFLGDDGFGVEVAQRLTQCDFPAGVRVADFGIRGFDLAFALQDGYETTILIDAFPHGEAPGTVYVVEPDLNDPAAALSQENFVNPHAMNPVNVLRMAIAMKAPLKKVLLVGCEPATFGGEEGHMGLSPAVEAAIGRATKIVAGLVEKAVNEGKLDTPNYRSADLRSAS
jgi:hydrogenase maturation protease